MVSRIQPIAITLATMAVIACMVLWSDTTSQVAVEGAVSDDMSQLSVEPDMHEFMEYVFEPTFKRLNAAMASAPADNRGWKSIKADSLVLAEAANLLLARQPESKEVGWGKHSTEVRSAGGLLYQAAKKKDFANATQQYQAMVTKCNACHQQFADGEHQLKP